MQIVISIMCLVMIYVSVVGRVYTQRYMRSYTRRKGEEN